eukprot:15402001-Heterocapsa_arctica.AAC.1
MTTSTGTRRRRRGPSGPKSYLQGNQGQKGEMGEMCPMAWVSIRSFFPPCPPHSQLWTGSEGP